MKKYYLAIVITIILTLLSGCALVRVNPERDRMQELASFDSEVILKGEVLDVYEQQREMWGITAQQERDPQQREAIVRVKTDILDRLIEQRILENKAEEAGFLVRPEDLEQAGSDLENQILTFAETLQEEGEAAGEEGVDYVEQAREVFNTQLTNMGMTRQEYIELIATQNRIQAFREETLLGIEASEEDVQAYYDAQLQAQRADGGANNQGETIIYRAQGVRVKHILIGLPDEERSEYDRLIAEGANDEAEEYLAQALEAIRPTAQGILDRAKAGEDFEMLIETYGEDPGMVDNEEGYIVNRDGGFIPQFEEAAFALEQQGDISPLVGGRFGYHIIKLYEVLPENIYTLEEKREEIQQLLDGRLKEAEWNSMVEQWSEEANIVRYLDRL